jgi:hypothetical protein
MPQTQTQTQIQNQVQAWRKAVEFMITCLKEKKNIRKTIANYPMKEPWEIIVYRTSSIIDAIKLKLMKKFEDEKVPVYEEKAVEETIKLLNVVMAKVEELAKVFTDFPIEIVSYSSSGQDLNICVDLTQYIDKQRFSKYLELTKKMGLKYMGRGNCVQVLKL